MCIDAFNDGKSNYEVDQLLKEIESLKASLARFVQGEENLTIMLNAQRYSFDRQGIRYQPANGSK